MLLITGCVEITAKSQVLRIGDTCVLIVSKTASGGARPDRWVESADVVPCNSIYSVQVLPTPVDIQ